MGDTEVGKIDATGLKNLRGAFKQMGSKEFDRFLKKAHTEIAQKVVDKARPGIAAQSSSSAGAVVAVKSATKAAIRIDRNVTPQAAGVIFGAHRDRPRLINNANGTRTILGWNQFRPFRRDEAYHIWPELDEIRGDIAQAYVEQIGEFLDSQGVHR